jgi:hypothetical protein
MMTHQPCHTDVLEEQRDHSIIRISGLLDIRQASFRLFFFFAYIRPALNRIIYRDSFTRLRPAGTSDEHQQWNTRQSQASQQKVGQSFCPERDWSLPDNFLLSFRGTPPESGKKVEESGQINTTPWTNSAAVAARRRRLRLLRSRDPPVDTLSSESRFSRSRFPPFRGCRWAMSTEFETSKKCASRTGRLRTSTSWRDRVENMLEIHSLWRSW